jgi:dihydrofolate reductase
VFVRRLKLQTQITLDGYMAGPNGEMDWMLMSWSDDTSDYIHDIMASVDTILLGRKLADGFIPAWESRPEGEPDEAIDWMVNTPKVIVTNTLTEPPRDNVTLLSGDLVEGVTALKVQAGGDIIVYGGGELVGSLVEAGLIDELHLFVNPTAIGTGMPVFGKPNQYASFAPIQTRQFDSGMLVIHLEPRREEPQLTE